MPSAAHFVILASMPVSAADTVPTQPTVRLKTLVGLRWFAVIGQAITVLVVHYWFEFDLPLATCLSVIALSAWLNVAMSMHFAQRAAAPAAAGRVAARLRHRAAHRADGDDRRHRESVRVSHPGAGADRRDFAAAALHAAARPVRGRLLDGDRVLFLAAAVDEPAGAGAPAALHLRDLDREPRGDRVHRRLCVAGRRGRPPDGGRADRDRTGAGARAASLAARRARGRRRA